jgi:hypothetical protein
MSAPRMLPAQCSECEGSAISAEVVEEAGLNSVVERIRRVHRAMRLIAPLHVNGKPTDGARL